MDEATQATSPIFQYNNLTEKQGYYRGCPGLTRKAINKHLGIEAATEQGWMKQHSQHPQSSSSKKIITIETSEEDIQDECTAIPQQEPDNAKTHEVYFTATESGSGLIYIDQTGKFSRTSNQGYKYLAIFYIYDANAVLSVPIKSREKGELLRSYQKIYSYLDACGFKPKLH